jgi:hypothetical protein
VTRLSERLEAMLHARLTDEDSIIREAMELAKRYEDAPVGFVMGQGLLTGGAAAIVQMERPEDVKGQRVRILLDTDPNPHQ